jgi:hypothetical protein
MVRAWSGRVEHNGAVLVNVWGELDIVVAAVAKVLARVEPDLIAHDVVRVDINPQ